jgi:cobalt/nickel transport system permease protein
MRRSLHDVWGCGRGPVKRAAPWTRLVAGAAALAACMIPSGATLAGSLCVAIVGAAWGAACWPPGRVVRASLLLGVALFLPYFLLLPLLPGGRAVTGGTPWHALIVPWAILLHGLCGMLVSLATVTSLSAGDLREALLRLPVPGIVSSILLQIVHQTANLFYETRRVAAAMAVRGASSGGVAAWRVLASLPGVWLPRIMVRAERVGAAMELRGYCDASLPSFRRAAVGLADIALLSAAAAALGVALSVRILGAP